MIRLDIISDPICPWCYIGKARLETALRRDGSKPFDIHWRPFQLNPDMPPEGMDRQTYLEGKFGKTNAAAFYGQIAEAAMGSGLDVRFDQISRTPNTIDAHRLIRWAHVEGVENAVVSTLFVRYFREGQDISDHAVLCDVAERCAMDPAAVSRLLAGDADRAEVVAEDAQFRAMGVSGVPCFIIDNRFVVNGAQEPDMWLQVIKDIHAQVNAADEVAQ